MRLQTSEHGSHEEEEEEEEEDVRRGSRVEKIIGDIGERTERPPEQRTLTDGDLDQEHWQ